MLTNFVRSKSRADYEVTKKKMVENVYCGFKWNCSSEGW
jgi:hypothetical protein